MFRKTIFVICIFAILTACIAKKATPTLTPMPIPPTDTAPPPPTNTPHPTYTPLPTPSYPTWTPQPAQPMPTPYPPGGAYIFSVYSPKADRALLFNAGNVGNTTHLAFLFNPHTRKWSPAQNTPAGCEWYDPGGVYDSQADRVLLYYSGNGGSLLEYDFNTDTWSDRKAANTPQGSHNTRMAYDVESQKTILVGGINKKIA